MFNIIPAKKDTNLTQLGTKFWLIHGIVGILSAQFSYIFVIVRILRLQLEGEGGPRCYYSKFQHKIKLLNMKSASSTLNQKILMFYFDFSIAKKPGWPKNSPEL